MKLKHNKRRNTAFLFEALIREVTRSVVEQNTKRKGLATSIIKKHFNKNSLLLKELELYKAILESKNMQPYVAEKLIQETKRVYFSLDQDTLFKQQSSLISDINQNLSKDVYSNFVPNFKSLATISQVFSDKTPIKSKVLLEESLMKNMTVQENEENGNMPPIDNLVYKTFVKKFNEEYGDKLHEEQKTLMNNYISSFSDNGIGLKMFLNEEVKRLKDALGVAMKSSEEINEDRGMLDKTKEVLELIEQFKDRAIDKSMVEQVLKVQNLIREIQA